MLSFSSFSSKTSSFEFSVVVFVSAAAGAGGFFPGGDNERRLPTSTREIPPHMSRGLFPPTSFARE
jgi:hypothetical protein